MQGTKSYTRLSQAEREQIFLPIHEGIGIREIGKRLGRTHSTISRELRHEKDISCILLSLLIRPQ